MNERRFEPLDVFTCPLAGIRQIEASAGTGKTWNICGLYLRLLLERKLTVQGILVVTFTNAATAELRDRIRQRIVDTLAALQPGRGGAVSAGDDFVERLIRTVRDVHGVAEPEMAARLDLALATFDEAAIFTIHGFCQRALADTPFTARMPLALELVRDDGPWVAQAVNDFWRRAIADEGLDAALAGHLVARKDAPERLTRLLKRHLSKPMARAIWPPALTSEAGADIRAGAHDDALALAHAAAHETWHAHRDAIADLLQRSLPALSAVSYKEPALAAAIAGWDEVLRGADGRAALDVAGAKLELLGAAKLASATKKKQTTPSHPFFDLAQALLDLRAKAQESLALRRLALLRQLLAEGAQAQRHAKRRQRVIAFDDMLFNLHERLTGGDSPWLAGALKQRFPAALIDELQDTDPLQFAIFKAIYAGADTPGPEGGADPAPLFFVGDPKQAIYSFRNADLHTYLRAGDHAIGHYSLRANQRSTAPLITALNRLFMANPRAFMLDGLRYQEIEFGSKPRAVLTDHSAPSAPLQIWALPDEPGSGGPRGVEPGSGEPPSGEPPNGEPGSGEPSTGEPMTKRDADAAVVAATAAEIARLLAAAQAGSIILGQGEAARALSAGDIAVLVRSNAQGTLIRQALAALNVGSVELSQASVLRSADAEELDRVLTAVLEPTRERKLKAALATQAMGYDAAAIARLADDESELLAVVQRFADLRDTWLERGIGFMLREWLANAGVTARLLARADGERRLTNLLHLVECLVGAEQTHGTPDALLAWFQSQRLSPEGDDATQLRLESDRDLVQIVTIHKSKGLEYGIVFCPFLWAAGSGGRPDGLDGVAYHDDDGTTVIDYGHEFLDEERKDDIKRRLRLEESAETLRLIYVALTRAVHRCVLVAGCYRVQTARGSSTTASTRSLLNWLVAGAGLSPAEWFEHKMDVAAIRAAWTALAAASGGTIAIQPLPLEPGVALRPPSLAPDALAALDPPRVLPSGWRIGSFSAIAQGALHDRTGVDHDLRVSEQASGDAASRPAPRAAAPQAADDILDFPRGPVAGECIHQLLERIDFTTPAGWPAAIAETVQSLRISADDGRDADAGDIDDTLRSRMLARMLDDVLHTPLPLGTANPLQLADLPAARRLVELEFHLPSHRLDARTLNETLTALGYAVPPLTFTTLRGFLKGFIDLVFEHEGRYFILDWKSNHLGDAAQSYAQAPMAAAMHQQGYHLQYLLYSVALHRYLRLRLPLYSPERHFGGAVYLFVRGVRPDWRDERGAPTGVFWHRPSAQAVLRLSALFDHSEVPA